MNNLDTKNVSLILKEKGKVVAIKTDTVYGLICNAFDREAVAKIYRLKQREKKKPLSIFVKDIDSIRPYIVDENLTKRNVNIMEKYWPGALTIIFKKKDDMFSYLTEGSSGIGIRIPNDSYLLELLELCDFPLAETSCNISGEGPYKNADEIREHFGDSIDLIVDGGETKSARPSTVLSLESGEPILLRLGDVDINV